MSIKDEFDLAGRTAVITGGGGGIGRETALVLAEAGANVVVGDVKDAGLRETIAMAEDIGGKGLAVPTDVTKKAQVEALVAAARDQFGSVDIMCNVAGIIRNNLVVDTPEEELDAVLAVNLKGVYFGCQAAAAVMIQQRRGSIINFASTGMDSPVPTISCYALTKAAVAMLTRTLATEVGQYGVRVNAMAPGFTDDDGTVDASKRDELWTMRGAQAPLNCIGTARDQALGVLYLASDASRFVTGQVMRINGGVSMV